MTETEQESFLISIFKMAQDNHKGAIRLMFKLMDMHMPTDWDNRKQNRHKWRRSKEPMTEKQIIHKLSIED